MELAARFYVRHFVEGDGLDDKRAQRALRCWIRVASRHKKINVHGDKQQTPGFEVLRYH